MSILLLGAALFSGLHFFTTLLRPLRERAVARIGAGTWKVLIAMGLVLSIWLMVRGYGTASAAVLWVAPGWMRPAVVIAMLPVLILYMGTHPGSAIGARVRHPQLTAFKLWAILHLIVNGDVRSVILFGGLLAWAVVQVIVLNRRDGKPPLPQPNGSALKAWAAVPVGVVLWAVLIWVHTWLGVSPLG